MNDCRMMFHWARILFQLQIGVSAVIALLLSIVPLAGSVFGAGRQIAFESDRDGNWEIYLMDIDRHISHNLTRSPNEQRSPTWSDDGRKLAYYSSYEIGVKSDIYAMDVISGETQQLTADSQNNWMPSWSPDGQHIVFGVNFGGIFIMDADGSNSRQIGYGFRPAWSPDSRHLIFYADRPGNLSSDIYSMKIEDGIIRNLTQHSANDWDPAWSPDGLWIAFVSVRNTNSEIYIMPACAEGDPTPCAQAVKPVTHNLAADIAPAWSPDSRQIAFTSKQDGVDSIFVVDIDGTNLIGLTSGGSNNSFPAWRPG